MDKTMINGASRRSINNKRKKSVTHKRNNLIPRSLDSHHLLQASDKSKKEKLRSLSSVSKALSTYQMGCHHLSDSNNKFKLPNKDCNGGVVHHASVPRKIRSAMKKRGHESILTDSEKVNRENEIDGIESPEKDGIKKKSKKKGSTTTKRQGVLGPITKDEEEVAETLYALAGMFPPTNDSEARTELGRESLPESSLVLQDHQECANAIFEASGTITTTQGASLFPERSPTGDAKISSLNETSGQEQADRTASNTNMPAVPMIIRSESGGKVASHGTELCLEMGLNVTAQSQNSHPDMELEKAGGIGCKQELHIIKHFKENEGPALWPSLSARVSSRMDASELQSSAPKAPNWLNAAIYASKQDLKQSFSSGDKMQISGVGIQRKSWKKCAAHVHISHLIRSLEVPNGQVTKEPDRVHHGSECGVLLETNNLNWMSNGNSSASGIVHSATVRSSQETKSCTPQQHSHYLDMSRTPPPTFGAYGPQKQNFNFLSLSVGGNYGLKVKDSFNEGGSRLESLSKSQVTYLQSLQQQHGLMPLPTPQSQHASSTSYLDQLPAVRLQQPHYYGTPLCGTQYSSTASYKQQQQSFWEVQVAANGNSAAVNCNVMRAQYPNWQSGRVEPCAVSPYAQVILPRSSVSLGSKITSISQQNPFTLASSLHPSRTIGLDIHLPSVCEESKARFRSNGTPSLQLLCDDRF